MSSIWTTARGPRHIRPHRAIAWRVIEGQHRVPSGIIARIMQVEEELGVQQVLREKMRL